MAIGTYTAGLTDTGGTYYSSGWSLGVPYSFNVPVTIKSALVKFGSGGTFNGRICIWNGITTSAPVATSAYQAIGVVAGETEYEVAFSSPFQAAASTVYYIGWYNGNGSGLPGVYMNGANTSSNVAYASTPAGITMTRAPLGSYQIQADSNPYGQSTATYELKMRMTFDITNTLPNAPTGVAVTNSPVPYGTAPAVSWTYSDPDAGQAQSKYQIRWRKAD